YRSRRQRPAQGQAGAAEPFLQRDQVHPGRRPNRGARRAGRSRGRGLRQRHGIGIAPEDQEAIFEEFRQGETVSSKVERQRLGLALARKVIALPGGHIWINSVGGVGSTFTFTLPLLG